MNKFKIWILKNGQNWKAAQIWYKNIIETKTKFILINKCWERKTKFILIYNECWET